MNEMLYAAYGSNLNVEQMSYRCPGAKRFHKAVLEGYELVFRGSRYHAVATIEPKKGSNVPIMLWTIGDENEKALDAYEGYPNFYGKEIMAFNVDGKSVEAMVYVMTPGHLAGLPSENYYTTILQGYEDCGLDSVVLDRALDRSMELIAKESPTMGELQVW